MNKTMYGALQCKRQFPSAVGQIGIARSTKTKDNSSLLLSVLNYTFDSLVEKHWNASDCECTRSRAYREESTDVEFNLIWNIISTKLLCDLL
jgi:hypothetical protein